MQGSGAGLGLQPGEGGVVAGGLQADVGAAVGQGLQFGCPVFGIHGLVPAQQAAQGTLVGLAGFGVADLERRKPHPQRMARAGEGHVEQAQVFAQAFGVGLGQVVFGQLQHQPPLPAIGRQAGGLDVFAADRAKAGAKRQADHGVFQPLAFVDGDELDQIGIAFQAHHLLVVLAGAFADLALQPADEGLLAFQVAAGGLQQFGQVQKVGEPAFAIGLLQPAGGQPEAVQRLAQHGQHALAVPDGLQLAHVLAALVEGFVVGGQAVQLGQTEVHAAHSQRGTHQQRIRRSGHAAQPVHEVAGFLALEHRVFVGQVDRGHAPALQRTAHGGGFFAGAHQHGNVARAQALERRGRGRGGVIGIGSARVGS